MNPPPLGEGQKGADNGMERGRMDSLQEKPQEGEAVSAPLRTLILEDRPTDAELMLHELRRSGFELDWLRVETEEEFLASLEPCPDVILADYSLPQFNGLRALRYLRERDLDIPFIMVTGALRDDSAAECMKQGADDFLLKDRLTRLGPAVSQALEQRRSRLAKRHAERVLAESEEIHRFVVDGISDGIAITVGAERAFVNKAFLHIHGLTDASQALSFPMDRFILPEDREMVRERSLARQRGEAMPGVYEYHIRRPNGDVRTLQSSAVPITYKGKPATLAVLRDITELKQAEQRLIETSRLASIGELAAGVAHEINNPLSIILGFSQLLLEQELDESAKKDVMTIVQEANRATKVVRDLLAFARQHDTPKGVIALDETLEKALSLKASDLQANNIEVAIDVAPDTPVVLGDEGQLLQVFINIMTNAQQEMAEAHGSGKLEITVARSNGKAIISFADSGPGIAEEHLARVFNPFFTTKGTGKGTGLGLSVSYGIVVAHGGRLWAESEEGEGATFKMELPVYDDIQEPQRPVRTDRQ